MILQLCLFNIIFGSMHVCEQSCRDSFFALVLEVYFFGGIQHSPVDGCSAMSFNFGDLTGEDEYMSFYSTIFLSYRTAS